MTIDDLKAQWNAPEPRPSSIQIDPARLREAGIRGARRSLRFLMGLTVFELILNLLSPILFAPFVASHLAQPRFLIPGLTLEIAALLILAATARQVWLLQKVEFDSTILAAQQAVEQIRIERIRTTFYILLFSPLLWTPLLIVCFEGLLDVNAYLAFGGAYLWANLAFGAAIIPLALWISRRFVQSARPKWLHRIMDQLGGYNLQRAKQFLSELAAAQGQK